MLQHTTRTSMRRATLVYSDVPRAPERRNRDAPRLDYFQKLEVSACASRTRVPVISHAGTPSHGRKRNG
jgi:hypothetical protein